MGEPSRTTWDALNLAAGILVLLFREFTYRGHQAGARDLGSGANSSLLPHAAGIEVADSRTRHLAETTAGLIQDAAVSQLTAIQGASDQAILRTACAPDAGGVLVLGTGELSMHDTSLRDQGYLGYSLPLASNRVAGK
jgi:hypothetical protein